MMHYKDRSVIRTKAEEYTFIGLVRCVLKAFFRCHDINWDNCSLEDLQAFIKKVKFYDGILDDCKRLGLDSDKILNDLLWYLKSDRIKEGVTLILTNKVHHFVARDTGKTISVKHRSFTIPLDVLHISKKGGI